MMMMMIRHGEDHNGGDMHHACDDALTIVPCPWRRSTSESQWRPCEIRCMLLLCTNRKSHSSFPFHFSLHFP